MLTLILSIVKSRESAEEVLQDVLMAIVTEGRRVVIRNAKGWLFKVLRNLSMRKAKEDHMMETESLSDKETIQSGEDVQERIEDKVDQIEALKCLDQIEQQCVLMCVFGDMKLPQVAEVLGIPYDKVRNKYGYAVRKLRKYYGGRFDPA